MKRRRREPTGTGPPSCVTDHPPARYAQIHTNNYLPLRTTPLLSQIKHPRGVYIFQKGIVRMQTTVYTDIIDYAMPTMMAEKALKEMHEAALMRRYDKAIELALIAAVHCREAKHAFEKMKEMESDRAVAVGA